MSECIIGSTILARPLPNVWVWHISEVPALHVNVCSWEKIGHPREWARVPPLAAAHRAAMELFSKGEERAERDAKKAVARLAPQRADSSNPESKRNPQSTHAPMAIDGVAAWPPRGPALGSRFFAWAGSFLYQRHDCVAPLHQRP